MLLFTNFIVIALALFLALVVAASAANLHGLPHGDDMPVSEWRTTVGPDMPGDDQLPANLHRLQKGRVVVLGQPLKPEQAPRLVHENRKRA